MKPILFAIASFLSLSISYLQAQHLNFLKEGDLIEVSIYKGGDFIGFFLAENDSFLIINHIQVGELPFWRNEIKRITHLQAGRFFNGQYWPTGINDHYYYSLPNAFTLPKGDIFYRNDWLNFNQVAYGVSSRISIGLSFDAFSIFSQLGDNTYPPILALSPKYSIPAPTMPGIQFAAGAFILSLPDYVLDERDGPVLDAALVYGLGTLGTRDRNLTMGLAYGYANQRWSTRPAFFIGSNYRVARWLSAVGEAWVFPQYDASIGTIGIKIHRPHSSFQLAFPFGTFDRNTNILPIPLLSYSTAIWNVYR